MRHSELERIIHISIISLPLYGPLLSNLMAFLAFPRLQQFIPAAAVHWREIEEIRTVKKHEFRNAQVKEQTHRERNLKSWHRSTHTGWYTMHLL